MDSTTPEGPSGPDEAPPTSDGKPSGLGPTERTVRWYDRRAEEYAERTRQIGLGGLRDRFLALVPEGSPILDVGCGAGRDLRYFSGQGREVVGIDPSEEMARLAADYARATVHSCRARSFEPSRRFGGIWACASLLHVPEGELPDTFAHLGRWLQDSGVLYASFRTARAEESGRFFNEVSPKKAAQLAKGADGLSGTEVWTTEDASGREDVRWTNVLARRLGPAS
jgi:SAM-dependent methyltransferase